MKFDLKLHHSGDRWLSGGAQSVVDPGSGLIRETLCGIP